MALVRPKNIPTSNLNGTISASQIGQLDFNNASIGSIIQVKTGELSSRVVYNQQSFWRYWFISKYYTNFCIK